MDSRASECRKKECHLKISEDATGNQTWHLLYGERKFKLQNEWHFVESKMEIMPHVLMQ